MKILHIISSPRGEASLSIKLGNAIVEKLQKEYPGSELKVHNLTDTLFPHLEASHIASFFTPAESRTPALLEAILPSESAIAELKEADIIVIGVPIYNFNIHSTLKAWIDHIARAGITFNYTANGPVGLITGKKVYLAISSGGVYSEGPMKSMDFSEPYLRTILGFIGITDIHTTRIEGTAIPELKEHAWEKAEASIAL